MTIVLQKFGANLKRIVKWFWWVLAWVRLVDSRRISKPESYKLYISYISIKSFRKVYGQSSHLHDFNFALNISSDEVFFVAMGTFLP